MTSITTGIVIMLCVIGILKVVDWVCGALDHFLDNHEQ